jgi:hypothetical protein
MAAAMLAPTPPTSSPSTLEEFLSNATNDRYSRQYPALMLPFIIDGVNANVVPAAVRDQVVEATAQHEHQRSEGGSTMATATTTTIV